ncbi:hypothetical protein [Neisseria sicca]|uniref:hypothetical protein n=1 Tax=Neisseria sicca TaxID=490 RepID=UPI000A57EF4C
MAKSFQHTAARRRLGGNGKNLKDYILVSTHSRPKAAGCTSTACRLSIAQFQHTAARRRLGQEKK